MANIKTAISIPQPLFEQVEALTREMHISRSHLFTLAVESLCTAMRINDSLSILIPLTQRHQSQMNKPSCAACVGSIGRWSKANGHSVKRRLLTNGLNDFSYLFRLQPVNAEVSCPQAN